ncbi:MAG TPA: DoxX family protein [Myxococcales bacterium]|nr:DoxX family protein [Myxococcales bacterium]
MALALEWNDARLRKEIALIPPRAALGASMVYHGLGKLREGGAEQVGQFFESVGLRPGRTLAVATGAAEMFAGVAAILGLWTRPAALAVLVTQAVALAKVHARNGYDVAKGGYEYNLALMAIASALLIAGPGSLSTHEAIERLAEGRGAKKLLRRVRPSPLLRLIKALK